ncbi:ribonuclease domain-containing protein [Streptomyces sp. H27-C3]|uniref:ribonuclease domain-containing protein n=1 Tax=Streptomyces sp. H27-C3 TaxID=3046305 RepID=UPI0024B9D69E|nr:ribonuclease domain-containing protein [Streptomyces sp. H27-C3]MDJ0461231.1 ribonuclease domain-containing protein [Streptomyces sp. H27-C3]
MRIPPRISAIGGIAALVTTLLLGGPGSVVAAPSGSATPTVSASAPAVVAAPAAVGEICYSALPAQAHDTLDLIEAGGPYPYDQDGTVFQNREGILPSQAGYYHEYTVITPGSSNRGARRIVTGDTAREDYYTADHYESFDLVDHDC